jgi:hypothetical protein
MNYTKPEVAVLGQAVLVIEGQPLNKIQGSVFDGTNRPLHVPAYDLDE